MFESINAVGFFENLWGLFDIGGRMKQNAFWKRTNQFQISISGS